tara:strand:- start:22619 stop:23089 length:471 start_codon:yes stop_codon:yes gene_type:complete
MMPLFDYACPDGHVEEHFISSSRKAPHQVPCNICIDEGPDVHWAIKQVPSISRTANKWGDTNGYYSPNLGAYVSNSQERDRIMRSKGLVDLRDMDKHFFEDRMEKECSEYKEAEADSQEYKRRLADHGDAGRAAAETFSVEKMKSKGLLEEGIRGE